MESLNRKKNMFFETNYWAGGGEPVNLVNLFNENAGTKKQRLPQKNRQKKQKAHDC